MYPSESKRDTHIEIDLGALKSNLKQIVSRLQGTRPIAVVKADAYGHGAVQISLKLKEMGINRFAVSNLDEAIELRENGINNWILILGPIPEKHLPLLNQYHLTPTLSDKTYGELLFKYQIEQPAQIKVDTGMGRLGISDSDALKTIEYFLEKGLPIEGIFSHLSCADSDPNFTQIQIEKMTRLIKELYTKNIRFKDVHIANSYSIFRNSASVSPPFSWVRPGLALYGYVPEYNLKEMMSLKTSVVTLRKLSKGNSVSYSRTYQIRKKQETIAVIPIGYGDGLPVNLSNKGFVAIRGHQYPIVGRICMDYTMVSLGTQVPEHLKPGEEVCVIGNGGMTIRELSNFTNRIPYETTCGMSKRLPRIYTK